MAKSPNAFRTISEAAAEVGVPQHVLRFWETKFLFVQPVKRAGGRRFYRSQDIVALQAVRRLLHDEGLTIKGVQRLHRTGGLKRLLEGGGGATGAGPEAGATVDQADHAGAGNGVSADRLAQLLGRLEAARDRLETVLSR